MSVKCLQIFFLADPIQSNLSHGLSIGFFWLALIWRPPNESEHWLWPTQRHGGCGLNTLELTDEEENIWDKDCSLPLRPEPGHSWWDWCDIQILWTQDDGLIKPDKTETGPWGTFFENLVAEYKWISTRYTVNVYELIQFLCLSFWQIITFYYCFTLHMLTEAFLTF